MDIEKMGAILGDIAGVMHPAIDLSLTELGIVKDIDTEENEVDVLFAFPFAGIPIADKLINSIGDVVKAHDAEFKYEVVVMTDAERAEFMKLEQANWKGGSGGGGGCAGCG